MIPKFPKFKKLELADRGEIEAFAQRCLPYSDFNFVSLWTWDIKEETIISQLHNNLAIRFTDYMTHEPFFSFLGDNNANETAHELLELSKRDGLDPILKLVPEDSVLALDDDIFTVTEDRDNFDYIYDIEELKNLSGRRFHQKCSQMKQFARSWPHAQTQVLDLKNSNVQKGIHDLHLEWIERRMDEEGYLNSHEENAIRRLLAAADVLPLLGVGIFLQEKMVAFMLNELTGSEYAIAHMSKIDRGYIGVNAFLMKKNAEILHGLGKTKLNSEQDLGVGSLRDAKMRFRPSLFFKKYKLTYTKPKLL